MNGLEGLNPVQPQRHAVLEREAHWRLLKSNFNELQYACALPPQWDFSSMWPENSCGCCHWNYQQCRVQVFKIATDLCIIARRDQNSFVFPFLYNSPLISQQVKDDRQADMSVNPKPPPPTHCGNLHFHPLWLFIGSMTYFYQYFLIPSV